MPEYEILAVAGDAYTLLATGDMTAGAYATIDALIPPGGGPPPHIHSREEETFYVLEGEVTFFVEETVQVAAPGTFLRVPRDVRHSFQNCSAQNARLLISVVPAGLENLFRAIGSPLQPGQLPSPPTPEQLQKLVALAPEYGIELIGHR